MSVLQWRSASVPVPRGTEGGVFSPGGAQMCKGRLHLTQIGHYPLIPQVSHVAMKKETFSWLNPNLCGPSSCRSCWPFP